MVCLAMFTSCIQKEESQSTSVLHTSRYELGNVVSADSTEVLEREKTERRADLDSFLVDYEVVRRTDSMLSRKCDWYCLKTLINYDASVNCSLYVDIPNTSSSYLNASIKSGLNRYRDDFFKRLRELDEDLDPFIVEGMYSDFRARLISAYEDSMHISFCFSINEYLAGAPHGNHFYQSFNYDKRRGRLITFNDLFDVKTSEDSTLMVDLVKATIGEEGLDPFSVYEYDFNLNNDYIVFNFDAYEIASYAFGSPRAALDRTALLARFGRDRYERTSSGVEK